MLPRSLAKCSAANLRRGCSKIATLGLLSSASRRFLERKIPSQDQRITWRWPSVYLWHNACAANNGWAGKSKSAIAQGLSATEPSWHT